MSYVLFLYFQPRLSQFMFPKFEMTKYIKSAILKAEYVKALVAFAEPKIPDLASLQRNATISRTKAMLMQEGISCDYNAVKKVLEGAPDLERALAPWVLSLQKANTYAEKRLDSFELMHLKKCHEILLRDTRNEKYGGILRNVSDNKSSGNYELPENEQLSDLTLFILKQMKSKKAMHPLIKSWTMYLLFDIVQPFMSFNQALSLTISNQLLSQEGFHFNGLYVWEKQMMHDWNTHQSIKLNSLFPVNSKERLESDATAFFENCAGLCLESLAEVEDTVIDEVKASVGYAKMSPHQKNSFNYLFDYGFKQYYNAIDSLNERQQSILRDVTLNRNVTTKQMVMEYRCDRKTIQRDFADLMDMGIIAQEGKTKTIIYHLSFN